MEIPEGKTKVTLDVLAEVLAERMRQDKKWGEQNHPDIHPTIQGETGEDTCLNMGIPTARQQKAWVDKCGPENGAFADIILEELCEAVEESDPAKRRKELIQIAAVSVSWVEAMDRRPKQ